MPSRLALLRHLWAYGTSMGEAWHTLGARLASHSIEPDRGRVLEIGCGLFYPYTMLFASRGTWIVGTDIEMLRRAGVGITRYAEQRRRHGWRRSALQWGFDLCRQSAYYGALRRSAGVPLRGRRASLVRTDAEQSPFRSDVFDLCISSAAFEHVTNVPAVVREMARVMRPGAFADIEIHLFPSLSGGHEFALANHRPPPPGFPVWRHVWDESWRPPVSLNRWRERDYRRTFEATFELVDRRVTATHGREYLTDEVLRRLPDYDVDELLTESVAYVLRKPEVSWRARSHLPCMSMVSLRV